MKRISFFIAFVFLFALAVSSFAVNYKPTNNIPEEPTIEAPQSTDSEDLYAKKAKNGTKRKSPSPREQAINDWFLNLSMSDKEFLYKEGSKALNTKRMMEMEFQHKMISPGAVVAQL